MLSDSIKYYIQKEKAAEQEYNKAIENKNIIIGLFDKLKKANKKKTIKEMNKTVKVTKKVYKETITKTSLNALREILVLNNIIKKKMEYLLAVGQTYYVTPNISTAKVLEKALEDYNKTVLCRKAVKEVYQTAMQADEEIETSDDDNNYDDEKL
jgi:hypothetical protein